MRSMTRVIVVFGFGHVLLMHVVVLHVRALLQYPMVDLFEAQHPSAMLGSELLRLLLVGETGQGDTHGALERRTGDVPGRAGVDQVLVAGVRPFALAHVMHVEL